MSRPTLSAVMGKAATIATTPNLTTKPRKQSKRSAGYHQLNVLLPAEMRRNVRAAAIQDGREVSDVAMELFGGWLAHRPTGQPVA